MKHNDGLDAFLTAMRYKMARACELTKKVVFGDDLPDDMPQDDGGMRIWQGWGLMQ